MRAGQVECQQCEAGFYANTTGLTTCIKCPSGRFSQRTTVGKLKFVSLLLAVPWYSLVARPLGTSVQGASSCQACAAGTFANSEAQTSCLQCPVGEASAVPAAVQCTPCIAGYFAGLEGSTSCTACSVGSLAPAPSAFDCSACIPGKIASNNASTSCIDWWDYASLCVRVSWELISMCL